MTTTTTRPAPEVGMVATFHAGSDRYPEVVATVSKSGHTVTTESGRKFTRRSDGVYRMVGTDRGFCLGLGYSQSYWDPSF